MPHRAGLSFQSRYLSNKFQQPSHSGLRWGPRKNTIFYYFCLCVCFLFFSETSHSLLVTQVPNLHIFIFFNCHLLHGPSTERSNLSYHTEVPPDTGTDMPCITRLKKKQQLVHLLYVVPSTKLNQLRLFVAIWRTKTTQDYFSQHLLFFLLLAV